MTDTTRPVPVIDMQLWRLQQAAREAEGFAQLPAPSVLDEDLLIHGLRGGPAPVERTEACACGGQIAAVLGDDRSILDAVARHNETLRHRAWRFDR